MFFAIYEVVKSKVWIEVSSFDSKKVRIENFRLESTFLKSKIFSIQNFRFEFDSKKVKWSRFESNESNRRNRIEKRNQKIEMTHTKLLTQKSQPNDSSCHGDQVLHGKVSHSNVLKPTTKRHTQMYLNPIPSTVCLEHCDVLPPYISHFIWVI